MKKYFLHDGSQQTGPFNLEELMSKNLNRNTPIWFEGLDEWTTIGKIDELKEIFTAEPPPFAAKMASPPPVQKPKTQTVASNNLPKQSSSTGRKLLIYAGIVVLCLIGYFVYTQIQQQQYKNERQNTIDTEEDSKARISNHINSYVTAERNNYQYRELGGIYNLEISVTNSTDYLIDNVKVRVIYIKANGDVWDSRIIDFSLLDPHSKNTIKVPDTNRGTSVQYEIVSIKSSALGLN